MEMYIIFKIMEVCQEAWDYCKVRQELLYLNETLNRNNIIEIVIDRDIQYSYFVEAGSKNHH